MWRRRLNFWAVVSLLLIPVVVMLSVSYVNARGFRPAYGALGPYPNAAQNVYRWVMLAAFYALWIAPCLWLVVAIVDRARGHRPSRGLCLRCGRNLTGNVSGECPECGHCIAREY